MNDTKITMKSLARQKADVRAKIARQHSELSQTYWDTLAPFYRLGNSPFSVLKRFQKFSIFQMNILSLSPNQIL